MTYIFAGLLWFGYFGHTTNTELAGLISLARNCRAELEPQYALADVEWSVEKDFETHFTNRNIRVLGGNFENISRPVLLAAIERTRNNNVAVTLYYLRLVNPVLSTTCITRFQAEIFEASAKNAFDFAFERSGKDFRHQPNLATRKKGEKSIDRGRTVLYLGLEFNLERVTAEQISDFAKVWIDHPAYLQRQLLSLGFSLI